MSSRQNEKNGNDSSVKWNCHYPVQNASILGGQSDSIFKTCDMGVSGDFCFVHTNTTKMAAIITEIVK